MQSPKTRVDLINRLNDGGHEMEIRVYYEDTDFSGVVYHANYLKFMERSRSEWLRHLGITHAELARSYSAFAVHRMALKFGLPARIDDLLLVRTMRQKLTGVRSFLKQEILRKEDDGSLTQVCSADIEIAFINHGGGAKRFPDDLREKLGG